MLSPRSQAMPQPDLALAESFSIVFDTAMPRKLRELIADLERGRVCQPGAARAVTAITSIPVASASPFPVRPALMPRHYQEKEVRQKISLTRS
jgi:hypothetical protein